MTQSPEDKNIINQTGKTQKSVGYVRIYQSDERRIERTTNGILIRQTKEKDGRETLYSRVEDKDIIEKIELRSENWRLLRGRNSRQYSYYVLEQRDASNRPTGCFKVIKQIKAKKYHNLLYTKIEAQQDEDWQYYARRSMNNEI